MEQTSVNTARMGVTEQSCPSDDIQRPSWHLILAKRKHLINPYHQPWIEPLKTKPKQAGYKLSWEFWQTNGQKSKTSISNISQNNFRENMNPHAHWENVGRGLGLLEFPESHSPCNIQSKKNRYYITYQQESYPPYRKGDHWPTNPIPLHVLHFHSHPDRPPYPSTHILYGSHHQRKTMLPAPHLHKNTS